MCCDHSIQKLSYYYLSNEFFQYRIFRFVLPQTVADYVETQWRNSNIVFHYVADIHLIFWNETVVTLANRELAYVYITEKGFNIMLFYVALASSAILEFV